MGIQIPMEMKPKAQINKKKTTNKYPKQKINNKLYKQLESLSKVQFQINSRSTTTSTILMLNY